jgi:hypothetical protein
VDRGWPHPGALTVALVTASALVPWRADALYAGGADPVVVAKAGLTLVALGLAVGLARARGAGRDVPAAPFVWVVALMLITTLGGGMDGRGFPTAVLAVRVLLVVLIIAVLTSTYRPLEVLHAVVVAFAVLVGIATVTTLLLGTTGRLHGGLPPLHANELAALAVVCLVWVVSRFFRAEDRPTSAILTAACVAIVVFTQSRTSVAAGAAALLLVVLFTTRVRTAVAGATAWILTGTAALLTLSAATDHFLTRGGEARELSTFENRSFAWQAALDPGQGFWHTWFGGGLAQKTVEVAGQPWTAQVLDSSWVSALVQGGRVGLVTSVLWLLTILRGLLRVDRAWRGTALALTVFLALRGFLESGLFDATTSFLLLATLAFTAASRERPVRQPAPDREVAHA